MQFGLFPEHPTIRTLSERRTDSCLKDFRTSPTTEVGQAAEHLVCADLLMNGWTAFLSGPSTPYDVVVEIGVARVRVQVKATLLATSHTASRRITPSYFFHLQGGKGKRPRYGCSEVDVFAFVALDRKLIAYFAESEVPKQQVALRVPGFCYGPSGRVARDFEGASFERALAVWRQWQSKSEQDAVDTIGTRQLFAGDV